MKGASTRLASLVVLAALSVWSPPAGAASKPYEDTRHRFKVDLPEGWELSPQFGDTSGMVFQKRIVGRRANTLAILIVHIDDFASADVKDYADKMEADLRSAGGLSRVAARTARVGSRTALVRELRGLISKQPKLEKTIEAYFLEVSGHMYMLHFESPSPDFSRIEADVKHILATFSPLAREGAGRGDVERPLEADAPNLSGRWMNDDGLLLVLGGDGSFALAEAAGRYEVKDGALTLIIPGQGREAFNYAYDASAGTLTLSSANLGSPMVYRRMKGGAPAPHQEPAKKPARTTSPAESEMIGRWSTPTPSGALVLELRQDHTFTMGKQSGQWAGTPERLTLTRDGAEPVNYRYRWSGDQLVLAGGDLDEEVTFQRHASP